MEPMKTPTPRKVKKIVNDSDYIRDAILQVIGDKEPYLVGAVTVVAEMVGENGDTVLFHLNSDDMPVWLERGMLMYRLDMLSGEATHTEFIRAEDK